MSSSIPRPVLLCKNDLNGILCDSCCDALMALYNLPFTDIFHQDAASSSIGANASNRSSSGAVGGPAVKINKVTKYAPAKVKGHPLLLGLGDPFEAMIKNPPRELVL